MFLGIHRLRSLQENTDDRESAKKAGCMKLGKVTRKRLLVRLQASSVAHEQWPSVYPLEWRTTQGHSSWPTELACTDPTFVFSSV
jgi:hypothetical protein